MKQALHILRKDFQCLRSEIGVMMALAALYGWVATHSKSPVWAEILICTTGAYLIARLIHAEAIPGDTQFWLTRPYRRTSLFVAKVLGMILFVNAPVFVSRAYVLQSGGFPIGSSTLLPLAWSQVILFFAGLGIAAIAAVTSSLVSFTFSILLLTAATLGLDALNVPPSLPAVRQLLTASQWVWAAFVLAFVLGAAVLALYLQYRWRKTWASRSALLAGGIVAAALYLYLPWTSAAEIQVAVSRDEFGPGSVRVRFEPSARTFFSRGMSRPAGFQVDVPLAVEGIGPEAEVLPDGTTLTFRAADGTSWSSGRYIYPALGKNTQGPGPVILNADVDVPLEFFEKARAQRVKVVGSLYLSVFGQAQESTIPLQARPAGVGGGVYCALTLFSRFTCASPLRWPSRLIYAKFDGGGPLPFTRVLSYSPFPAGLGFDVTESRDVGAPSTAREVTIVQHKLLAFFRHDFKIDNFPLAAMSKPIASSARRE